MKLNKLALCGAAMVGSLGMMGCPSDPPASTTDGGTVTGTDGGTTTTDPVSVTYIIGQISIPDGPADGVTPGFNLDDKVSAGDDDGDTCEDFAADYRNASGETGVDNQLVGEIVSVLGSFGGDVNIQATLDEQITSGSLLIALRVSDINDFTNDSSVKLDIFLVDPAGCDESPCPVEGGVVADAEWIRRASTPALASNLDASITGGVLAGGPLDLPISFTVSGNEITLTIRRARVGGNISATRIANGNIGGELLLDEVVSIIDDLDLGVSGETVRGVLGGYADLSPSAADPLICDSISAGIGFGAVAGSLAD